MSAGMRITNKPRKMFAMGESELKFTNEAEIDFDDCGRSMHRLVAELFPICRSITGNGVRETLRIIQRYIPLVYLKFLQAQRPLIGSFLKNGTYVTLILLIRGEKNCRLQRK